MSANDVVRRFFQGLSLRRERKRECLLAAIEHGSRQHKARDSFFCEVWKEYTNSHACKQRKAVAHLIARCKPCGTCTKVM